MSRSFESVRCNACVHRLNLGFFSHLKEFIGNGVRTHVNSKGEIHFTRSSEEDPTHNAASCRTASSTHCQKKKKKKKEYKFFLPSLLAVYIKT